IVGTAVLRIVASRFSMKRATATSHGRYRLIGSPHPPVPASRRDMAAADDALITTDTYARRRLRPIQDPTNPAEAGRMPPRMTGKPSPSTKLLQQPPLFRLLQLLAQVGGFVGGDAIHPERRHFARHFRIINGPDDQFQSG